jgi:AcrR family transcriptional regulator
MFSVYDAAMPVKRLRDRQAEATRAQLVAVARELFTARGYGGTSIEDIARQAGVAKGALYHHFSGKDSLFRAVYEAVLSEAISAVLAAAAAEDEPWASVHAGLSAFLDACLEPTFRRIVVLESITVLQPDAGEGDVGQAELPMLRSVLAPLADGQGLASIAGIAVDPLAHVALGGLYGAALYIARASDMPAARQEVEAVLDTLVQALGGPGAPATPGPSSS